MGRGISLLVLAITLLGCRSGKSTDVASSNQAKPVNQNASTNRSPGRSIVSPDQAEKSEARAILQDLRTIEQQGRSMQSLRNTTDLDKVRECGDLSRQRQQAARDLIPRAEKLAPRYGYMLAVAARELTSCVSCVTGAVANCDIARRSLTRAERAIK